MFFYLLYYSNLISNDENKLIKLLIYSIVLYIILHLIVNGIFYRFTFLGYYFWIIFILDCLSLGSILIRENNGEIVVNNINTIRTRKKQENTRPAEDEIERTTHNLEELLNETNEIKKMVNPQPETVVDNEEFNRFIEDLNNSDIEKTETNKSIQSFNTSSRTEIPKPTNIGNLEDDREKIMESLQNNISTPLNSVSQIDSDIDIDISDFDKLIE
jgi:hypothetical protein